MSAAYRLNRLFHATSGRCIDVAVDHGVAGEAPFLEGIEDMERAVATLVDAGPDAIQLTVGQAPLLQSVPGRDKPALVLRVDIANVYGPDPTPVPFSHLIHDAIGHAVRLDAACVCVNLLDVPGADDLRRQCVENITALRAEAERAGIPVMVEPLVMAPGVGGYGVDGDADRIVALVRQAVELGADVVKADPTDDVGDYGRVITAARVPVLVRGGGRVPDGDLLERTRAVLDQGARGIVYGRNVIQHADPAGMVRALRAVVHEGASAQEAAAELATPAR
ncbi:MAG: fructose-bisphosphate aldolase, class [Solirubrobacteraceae bacterium]|nr:fructose-bisphosphate aldolase, class [Solirubrobacteraceae bacterium]MEA2278916.1 fructose-bisphosphate aldolase, class [Solirubrobacteraceae bacterium]